MAWPARIRPVDATKYVHKLMSGKLPLQVYVWRPNAIIVCTNIKRGLEGVEGVLQGVHMQI